MLYSTITYSLLSMSVYPLLLLLMIGVFICIALILHFAMKNSVDALRLDAISRAPINSLFSTTLENLITIRAYKSEPILNQKF